MVKFEFLEHTADVKFQAFGKSLEKAFENAALALKETIAGKIKIKARIKKKIVIEGKDNPSRLYKFLEEFLYLLDAEDFILSKVKVKFFQKSRLEVEVWGDNSRNYKFTNEVKAVTYNQMFVKKEKAGWICQVVLDV